MDIILHPIPVELIGGPHDGNRISAEVMARYPDPAGPPDCLSVSRHPKTLRDLVTYTRTGRYTDDGAAIYRYDPSEKIPDDIADHVIWPPSGPALSQGS
jgi:hypothetical protein